MADIRPVSLSILIPVRNEGLNLKIMLKILKVVVPVPHEVLIIVDQKEDKSVSVVNEARDFYPEARWLLNPQGAGAKNAFQSGLAEAKGEAILIFAADEVGPVLAIEDMLSLLAGGCDFISCTRYARGGRRLGGSWLGGCLSRLANRLVPLLTTVPLSDATTGIKMFRKSIMQQIELSLGGAGWSFAFELALKAHYAGFVLGEVPIVSIDRLFGGKSSFRLVSWVREYGSLLGWAWKKEIVGPRGKFPPLRFQRRPCDR